MAISIVFWISGLIFAPLLMGIINRTKAFFAGRKGIPLLQFYYDIFKLMHKGAVYSNTTTIMFRAGPIVSLSSIIIASLLIAPGGTGSVVSFSGDLILFAYFLGLARFFTVVAALDTGSSFEGMGASREVWISSLAEPVLFLSFAALIRQTGKWSLSEIMAGIPISLWNDNLAIVILLALALFLVILAENSRIPVDDPNTHLELTMVHEVMVLDHGGIDLGFILFASSLKLWITGLVFCNIVFPARTGSFWLDGIIGIAGMGFFAVIVGVIESSMARLQINRIPQFMAGALSLASIALIIALQG